MRHSDTGIAINNLIIDVTLSQPADELSDTAGEISGEGKNTEITVTRSVNTESTEGGFTHILVLMIRPGAVVEVRSGNY